jgi:hypothetical protein
MVDTPLGSGLAVSDGRGYHSPQRPKAWALLDGRWRAEISGVEDGAVVRSWVGKTYTSKQRALNAAMTKAGQS